MHQPLKHSPTISIVIPCYNEADTIGDCLAAISHQTDMPDEVIVVDNNCIDETIAVAKRYSFVRVIQETQQGRSFARNRGFNEASGDILARIDADTILPPHWVGILRNYYATHGVSMLHGIAGSATFDTPNQHVGFMMGKLIFNGFFFPVSQAMLRSPTLFGSNMAITHKAWQAIADKVCTDDNAIHEDIDLSVHLLEEGGTISKKRLPDVSVSSRSMIETPAKFWWRLKVWPTPVIRHQKRNLFSKKH